MQWLGDFAEDATVYIPFNTFSSNDPQASVTITNLADADIMVHKDGSTTQIVTDGATIAIDFDSITGNHLATIDTSAHADYAIGSDYMVRIEGTTVDAGTINAWIGSFSIENRFDDDTAKASALATAQTDLDTITGSDGTTLATTQGNYAPATVAALAVVDTNVDQIETAVITNAAGVDIAADIIAIKAETALIVADTNELQTDNVPGLIAALNDISVADILTTQMTEAYAANGVAPTMAQSLFAIHQMLMQFGIAGTSWTVRKLDDSTTAFVVTLDDGTNPTDAKRV